jgi:hypothetical protein
MSAAHEYRVEGGGELGEGSTGATLFDEASATVDAGGSAVRLEEVERAGSFGSAAPRLAPHATSKITAVAVTIAL